MYVCSVLAQVKLLELARRSAQLAAMLEWMFTDLGFSTFTVLSQNGSRRKFLGASRAHLKPRFT